MQQLHKELAEGIKNKQAGDMQELLERHEEKEGLQGEGCDGCNQSCVAPIMPIQFLHEKPHKTITECIAESPYP
jgi:hypothetical protein